MRVLLLSQCYEPEIAAGTVRVKGLAKCWAEAGHEITILTGFPNYPEGRRLPGYDYGNRVFKREVQDGINVVRTWNLFYRSGQTIRRGLDGLGFMSSSLLYGLCAARGRYDLVMGSSPHSFLLVSTVLTARRCGVPAVLDIRDHWPETAPKGTSKLAAMVWKAVGTTVDFSYSKADLVVGVSPSYRELFSRHGVPEERQLVIPNGLDEERFPWPLDRDACCSALGLDPSEFWVSFVGTMGTGMGLETVLAAAKRLSDRLPSLRLLFVGQGASRAGVEAKALELGLDVAWRDFLPMDRIHLAYGASDLSLACLEDREEHRGRIPAKTFEILGSGVPVLALMPENPGWELVRASGGGVRVRPGDEEALAGEIERLAADPARRRDLGQSGSSYIRSRYTRKLLATQYLSALEGLVRQGRKRLK